MSAETEDPSGLPPVPGPGFRPGEFDEDYGFGEPSSPEPAHPEPAKTHESKLPGDSAFAAAPVSLEPSGIRREEGPGELISRCVLMGPSNAGKTTLLQAFDQACSCPPDGDRRYRLEFIGGEGTDKLAELGVRTIMEEDYRIDGTDKTTLYEASITATRDKTFWSPERQYISHLKILDGPGGALFPSEVDEQRFKTHFANWEAELIRDALVSDTLVLCVDATDARADLVTRYMRNILARLGQPYQRPLEKPLGYRLLKKLRLAGEAPPPGVERRINARRFLLLLTKIDQLVGREADWPEEPGEDFQPPLPARLASGLSPVRMACELLDETNLLRIRNALRPDAEFAVGLTSAWGFHPLTGRPFMEGDNPVGLSNQDRSQRLLNWRPFGVREALLFITTGETVGAVERLKAGSLGTRLQAPMFDVPPQFFDIES
jgi:hypothetical protein